MNKVYKLVWSVRRQAYIVTSEKSQSKGKLFFINLLSVAGLSLAMIPFSYAQCDSSSPNKYCGKNIINQYPNKDSVGKQSPTFISQFLAMTNFSNSVDLTISNHVESNDDGYNYMSGNDINDINLSQSDGEVIGGKNGINLEHNGSGSTTINISGDVTGKQNDGLHVVNSNNTHDLDIMELIDASIHGKSNGINAVNYGHGTTTISTIGSVVGDDLDGILAVNDGDTQGLNIIQSSGEIHCKKNGINADNKGKGKLNINTNDNVIGDGSEGINAVNEQNAGDLTISQDRGLISGALNGIKANNFGNGSTNITVAGKVVGKQNDGLFANNNSNTHDLTISQKSGEINGGANGINAVNNGNGSTIVTTSGKIVANHSAGVSITNFANTHKLTFNQVAGSIIGKGSGVGIINNGNETTSISIMGDIEGQKQEGMSVFSGVNTTGLKVEQSNGNIKGLSYGMILTNKGNGSSEINTNGTVTGSGDDGLRIINETNTRDLIINQNGGAIYGQGAGINITHRGTGSSNVTIKGNVTGNVNSGIIAATDTNTKDITISQASGEIHGDIDGINVNHNGTGSTIISTTGRVIGENGNGINATIQTNTQNIIVKQESGRIQGGLKGISLTNYGTGSTTVDTTGEVIGGQHYGIYIKNDRHSQEASVTQSGGSIQGKLDGINIDNNGVNTTTITADGDIIGTQNNGILVVNSENSQGITVSQNSGNIKGNDYGIILFNSGKSTTSVSVSGNVIGSQNDGITVVNYENTDDIKIHQ